MLNLFAAIDQDDTNWIIILKDVGPDPSVRTAREGEREIPADLAERELTRGWLKASNRALDPERSKPWKPWHKLTREAQRKVTPGKIEEYAIEIFATANLFRKGHRICVEITSLDLSDRRSRRHQRRIHSLSRVFEPHGGAQHPSRRHASLASVDARHSGG